MRIEMSGLKVSRETFHEESESLVRFAIRAKKAGHVTILKLWVAVIPVSYKTYIPDLDKF